MNKTRFSLGKVIAAQRVLAFNCQSPHTRSQMKAQAVGFDKQNYPNDLVYIQFLCQSTSEWDPRFSQIPPGSKRVNLLTGFYHVE